MITIKNFKSAVENCNSVDEMNEALKNMARRYGINLQQEAWDDTNVAAEFFETDDVSSRDFGTVRINLEPAEDEEDCLLNPDGSVYAVREREIAIYVFENYTDAGAPQEDYLFTYTIYQNDERKF